MSKMWVMAIGYQNYATTDPADAVKLVDIASRMVRVTGYSAPYVVDRDAPPLVEAITLADVTEFPEAAPAQPPVSVPMSAPEATPFDPENTPF